MRTRTVKIGLRMLLGVMHGRKGATFKCDEPPSKYDHNLATTHAQNPGVGCLSSDWLKWSG